MGEWKRVKLGDVCEVINGRAYSLPELLDSGKYRVLRVGNFFTSDRWYYSDMELPADKYCEKGDLLFAWSASFGPRIWDGEKVIYHYHIWKLLPDESIIEKRWLYYWLRYSCASLTSSVHGSVMAHMTKSEMESSVIPLPPLAIQRKIAAVLGTLDDKIENNRKICVNLEAQAQALFKSWFVDNSQRIMGRKQMQDVFNVSIGRTPPRKEFQWFSEKKGENIVWVSIADMGSCGAFISDSSEYLTPSAIERFNFKMVERGAVLLSFKLTVGRVAIADAKLVTNEAIAQLSNRDERYREYLYCYLRQFEFDKLGSTSSIATAVNSATIREMPFLVPNEDDLSEFHLTVYPMFEQIRMLLRESRALAATRDALLPKLMSGEIDVEKVEV